MGHVQRSLMGPSTPPTAKRPGGALEELLLQFGSQSSATSATKARRALVFTTTRSELQSVARDNLSDFSHASSRLSKTTSATVPRAFEPVDREQSTASTTTDTSDELLQTVDRPRTAYVRPQLEELKMENKRSERPETPRRSARNRKSDILASDTVAAPSSPSRRKITTPRKLNTARARLRDEIARKTQAKANAFLVANKEYFLPLLPPNNYISKLLANGQLPSTVKYERLSSQPQGITATLKPYQLDGLSFLVYLYNNGFSGILGDEMGLGKTLQTLSLIQYLEEKDRESGLLSEELRPYLIICPLSVLDSWIKEAQKWAPELKVLRFHGTPGERERLKRVAQGLEDEFGNDTVQSWSRKASKKAELEVSQLPTEAVSGSYKIIVTTYDVFKAEQSWFKHSFVWRYVVLDEGHVIKSSVTQVSTALKRVASEYRLILTGTPVQNNLVEMWSLLSWLFPDIFTDKSQTLFKESFDLNRGQVNKETMDNARHLLELIMLRRTKESPDVNLGLPPKEEVLLYVPLTPMQRFWYTRLLTGVEDAVLDDLFKDGKRKEMEALKTDKHKNDLLVRLQAPETPSGLNEHSESWEETARIMQQTLEQEQKGAGQETSAWRKLMNLVLQLRKCCSHPYLVPGAMPEPYYPGQHLIRASGKFILLEKLLKHSIFDQGKKVLIFSGFTETLDWCENMLGMMSNFGKIFRSLRLDGSTGRARRNLEIRLFNDRDSIYKVMLLSTRAGGLGITLTTAEDVIFLDEDWNPQVTLQAEARAHRIGQTKKVTVYKLCTQGTVEEQMMGRIRKKLYLSAKITETMRNKYGKDISLDGSSAQVGELPDLGTNQLKSLVRRGAQTLSHPEIDVTEMLSWDLDTMMQMCRDRPADPLQTSNTEVDEDKWLSMIEQVQCAVFDGKRYQRKLNKKPEALVATASTTREDRRKDKARTVTIDGFEVSKESLNCNAWEAVPTLAGKDPRLAEPLREKRRQYKHESHCLNCFGGPNQGHAVECRNCPRAYHFDCLDIEYQEKVKGFSGLHCPQHTCCECGKNSTDAGGLIFRCRWCPRGFCEDCLEWDKVELIGDNLPEFEILGEYPASTAFYIKCRGCVLSMENDTEQAEWISGMELTYREQHEKYLQEQEDTQRRVEEQQDAVQETFPHIARKTKGKAPVEVPSDDEGVSPPALTENSIVTGESRTNTPHISQPFYAQGKKRLDAEGDMKYEGGREQKRPRINQRASDTDDSLSSEDDFAVEKPRAFGAR